MVRSAPLVIDVGDGYQPGVEAAARSARRHLSLLPALSATAQPYEFWLDPSLMGKAADLVAGALSAADAGAKAEFENGSRDLQSVVASIESDLESTFSDCSRDVFVTSDDAFGRFAASYDLTDVRRERHRGRKGGRLGDQQFAPRRLQRGGRPRPERRKGRPGRRSGREKLGPDGGYAGGARSRPFGLTSP